MSVADFLWLMMYTWGAAGAIAAIHEIVTNWGNRNANE